MESFTLLSLRIFVLQIVHEAPSMQAADVQPHLENFTPSQGKTITGFLQWLHDNDRTIGYDNYDQAVSDYVSK